ncbi:hypothetical protein A0H81_11244 [Grifola frondosa]|uniref:Uncharacterized protein n=1 Tax=Grifola frondosa TaxID=5627 RepID=A0A1C7LVB9_GRIFR|nr:hypothetical protein A0H81_11244 [Grifola frondosa]
MTSPGPSTVAACCFIRLHSPTFMHHSDMLRNGLLVNGDIEHLPNKCSLVPLNSRIAVITHRKVLLQRMPLFIKTVARLRLPRRIYDEDAKAELRKRVHGLPGPVDNWISANRKKNGSSDVGGVGELRCTVQLEYIKAPDNGTIFKDPDHYILHFIIMDPSSVLPPAFGQGRRIVLGRFEGHSENLDAPDWTNLPPGEMIVFHQSIASVAELLVHVALPSDALMSLIQVLDAIQL